MTREIYFKKADAMAAAEEMIRLWGGWWAESSADDGTAFNYEDMRMRNISWSGEVSAVRVYGCRNGMGGLFAWWEE